MVKCRLNSVLYVRKSIDKATVLRCYQVYFTLRRLHNSITLYNQQCFPQTERDILLLARQTDAHFVPHLIAAYQSTSSLYLLMEYGSGGTLWDVLESSAPELGISETDLKWWIPQAVSAISWCHDQGFCHRYVLTTYVTSISSNHRSKETSNLIILSLRPPPTSYS